MDIHRMPFIDIHRTSGYPLRIAGGFYMSILDLDVSRERTNDGVRINAEGRVNTNNANLLRFEFEKALEDGFKNIYVNMSRVEYLSSTGIRVILKAYKDAAEAGFNFAVERPSDNVKNVLGIAALDELLIK